jgi:hypothetical protein
MEKPKLFIATPMFGGMCHGEYAMSLLDLMISCYANGISSKVDTLYNESLVTRGRNKLVHQFLKSEGTHLLFIDADIKFRTEDVFLMLQKDVDVIGGVYPKKKIDWANVSEAVNQGAEIEDLPYYSSPLNFNLSENTPRETKITDAIEVQDVATGMMLIKREVFEKLKPVVESYKFYWNESHAGETCYAFFDTAIMGEEYLSEDWYFCRKWKSVGGKIHAAPWCELTHYGTHAFKGKFMPDIKKPQE